MPAAPRGPTVADRQRVVPMVDSDNLTVSQFFFTRKNVLSFSFLFRKEQVVCWGPLDNMMCNNSFR